MNTIADHIQEINVQRVSVSETKYESDSVAIEAPLEIRLKRKSDPMSKAVAVTMRTPGNDSELALGFLFTEGIIKKFDEVSSVVNKEENVIEVIVSDQLNVDLKNADRNFYTTSSCGVCGKASIEAIKVDPRFKSDYQNKLRKEDILALPKLAEEAQDTFELTGGIHASTLFNTQMELVAIREDVGRHNALDKLIGLQLQASSLPLANSVLLLSGRASFELVQKAAMAGISIIISIGAPSSLAIDLAIEHSITLIGFLKKDRFNIYTGNERIEI